MILTRFANEMNLKEIIKVVNGIEIKGTPHETISGITYDSRLVAPGYLFATVRGSQQNGIDYVDEALHRGAVAIMSEYELSLPQEKTLIQVKDVRLALAQAACYFHHNPSSNLDTYGTTGTNGKTTVTFLIRALLEGSSKPTGLISSVEYIMGDRHIPAIRTTPEAPELQAMLAKMVKTGCHSAVMEVSSHALIQKRVFGIEFDVAIFTNLSQDHLDYHQNMEKYFEAKKRLFTEYMDLTRCQTAVVNIDDLYGQRLAAMPDYHGELITYGLKKEAMVRAVNVELNERGAIFDLQTPWGQKILTTPLPGMFNVYNVLASVAACGSRGILFENMCRTLRTIEAPPGRLSRVPSTSGHIFVDYAHTEQALRNVLATLRKIYNGPLCVIFGCGGDRDWDKRAKMARVVEQYADRIIVTTDNPRSEDPGKIAEDICAGFDLKTNYKVIPDREVAIAEGLSRLEKNDVLLIAGKGHEGYIEYENTVQPFDDHQVALKLLNNIQAIPGI